MEKTLAKDENFVSTLRTGLEITIDECKGEAPVHSSEEISEEENSGLLSKVTKGKDELPIIHTFAA